MRAKKATWTSEPDYFIMQMWPQDWDPETPKT